MIHTGGIAQETRYLDPAIKERRKEIVAKGVATYEEIMDGIFNETELLSLGWVRDFVTQNWVDPAKWDLKTWSRLPQERQLPPWRASLIEALTMSCAELEYEAWRAQQNATSCPQMNIIGRDQYDAVVGEEIRGMGGVETPGQILAKMWKAVAAEPPEQVAEEDLMALVATPRSAENDARLTAQAEQIGALLCEHDQLRREIAAVRELLSKVEDAPTDPVQSDIERTIDHLLNGRTTRDQRKGLNTAAERAERVAPDADAAVGRALR